MRAILLIFTIVWCARGFPEVEPKGDLLKAILNENALAVRALIQRQPELKNWNSGEPMFHPLMYYATLLQSPAIIPVLVDAGVNINACNITGVTALHLATYHNSGDLCRALVKAGASLTTTNKIGQTPIDLAKTRGSLNCLNEFKN